MRFVVALACLFFTANMLYVQAQSPEDAMATLRLEIQQLRKELEALKAELRGATAFPSAAGETPDSADEVAGAIIEPVSSPVTNLVDADELSTGEAVPLLRAQVAEQAQTKVESSSRLPVKIFGTLVSNTFLNTDEADWIDNPSFVLRRAPGSHGSFSSTLRQSRIGLSVEGPAVGSMKAHGMVEVDFYGGLPNYQTGQVMGIPRMLYGYMRIEGARTAFEMGQDQMILAPQNPTSLASRYFPDLYRAGNLYLRVPQLRVERVLAAGEVSEFHAEAGVLAPVMGDFCDNSFAFISPALGGERSRLPALQGRLAWRGRPGAHKAWQVGLSAHKGRGRFRESDLEECVEYRFLLPAVKERLLAEPANSWAGAIDFNFQAKHLGLGGEWYVGRNINALGGAIGQFAKSAGGFLEARLRASQQLEFNSGFGIDRLIERREFPARMIANSSVFANAIYQFVPELALSFEYRWLSTLTSQRATRRNHHFNLAFAYSF